MLSITAQPTHVEAIAAPAWQSGSGLSAKRVRYADFSRSRHMVFDPMSDCGRAHATSACTMRLRTSHRLTSANSVVICAVFFISPL